MFKSESTYYCSQEYIGVSSSSWKSFNNGLAMPIALYQGLFLLFKPTHTLEICLWEIRILSLKMNSDYMSKMKRKMRRKEKCVISFDTLLDVLFAFKETLAVDWCGIATCEGEDVPPHVKWWIVERYSIHKFYVYCRMKIYINYSLNSVHTSNICLGSFCRCVSISIDYPGELVGWHRMVLFCKKNILG